MNFSVTPYLVQSDIYMRVPSAMKLHTTTNNFPKKRKMYLHGSESLRVLWGSFGVFKLAFNLNLAQQTVHLEA